MLFSHLFNQCLTSYMSSVVVNAFHSFIYSLIHQQVFTERLQYSRHCSRLCSDEPNRTSAFREMTFYWKLPGNAQIHKKTYSLSNDIKSFGEEESSWGEQTVQVVSGLIDKEAFEQRPEGGEQANHDKINQRKQQYEDPEVWVYLAYLKKKKKTRVGGEEWTRGRVVCELRGSWGKSYVGPPGLWKD